MCKSCTEDAGQVFDDPIVQMDETSIRLRRI